VTEAAWRLEDVDGIRLARCAALERVPDVAHAFSTRIAFGRADFDLGPARGDLREADDRSAAFVRAAGLGDARPAFLRQVHGGVVVDASATLTTAPAADGVIRVARSGAADPVPVVRTADCVAVLVVDRNATAVAALHAGWRGVASGIGASAVARFAREGVGADDLVVALGPAILGCCYEVGDDVVAALQVGCGSPASYVRRNPAGRAWVDLQAALRRQLVAAGVPDASIHCAPWCTRCRTDLFFSFRGEGPGTGRLMATVGPAGGP
jgi:YfiH family protein